MALNHLAKETSPYLLQHRSNPVNWFAWGEDAFRKSREENKLIFLSIGYSTCYWCHVMEKESFEQDEVAGILNEYFVCIKVDREERPDVDAIYMDAVVQLTGHGGWPMSVFLTPELKPFYGGTYFPRVKFIALLHQIAGLWGESRERVVSSAEEFTTFLKASSSLSGQNAVDSAVLPSDKELVDSFLARFDSTHGGFGAAPKFPPTGPLRLLTSIASSPDPIVQGSAKHIVEHTLNRMAAGGIFDQLGGGFHRYSVDAEWLVPHFEKMLYDNALLVRTYLESYASIGAQSYLKIAESCLNYVLSEMTGPDGGFYSAEDAGEVGKEGEFYVWKESELRSVLSEKEFEQFSNVFRILPLGNFEHGTNVLSLRQPVDSKLPPTIEKLLKIRSSRVRPFKDDKIITAWNGLMIGAMAVGYRITGLAEYLQAAERAAEFIRTHLCPGGDLMRTFRVGEARNAAVLDDYAFLIDGLIELYQASFDEQWLLFARELQRTQDELFWDNQDRGYFSSGAGDSSLVLRKKELMDNAEPSANGLAIGNLSRLSVYFLEPELRERAEQLAKLVRSVAARYPHGFSYSLLMERLFLTEMSELVLSGERGSLNDALANLNSTYKPGLLIGVSFDGSPSEIPLLRDQRSIGGAVTYWRCRNGACEPPSNTDIGPR